VLVNSPTDLKPSAATDVAGERAARLRLERIFNEHHDFIWRLLRRLGLSREGADDAAQHVFVVAAERLADIREGRERAFLFGTALHVARRASRNEKRWVLEDDMDVRSGHVARPEDLADQRRALAMMGQILASLDEDLKTVFILAELEGQTMPEVAALLEIPLGTATSRLRRAREAFRGAVQALEASLKQGTKP
jgi:RNA polymerase sigma-70 factor (ECF subfamily)